TVNFRFGISKSRFLMSEIPSNFIRIRFSSEGQSIFVILNTVFFIYSSVFLALATTVCILAFGRAFYYYHLLEADTPNIPKNFQCKTFTPPDANMFVMRSCYFVQCFILLLPIVFRLPI